MKIFFFFLFLTLNCYGYDREKVYFTEKEFSLYIKPQLKSILTEYQSLLFSNNPHLEVFKPIFQSSSELLIRLEDLKKNCLIEFTSCASPLENVQGLIKKLLSLSEKISIEYPIVHVKTENFLRAYDLKDKMEDILFLSLERINTILTFKEEYENGTVEKIIFDLKSIFNLIHLMALEIVDARFQKEFSSFWVTFIKPIEIYILIENENEYIRNQVNELNLSLHELHVELTKRNKDVSPQVKEIIKSIDLRWRSILKIMVH